MGPTLLVLAVVFTNVKSDNIKSTRESSAKRQSRHIPPQQHFELWTESNLNIIYPPQLNFFKPLDHPSNFDHNKVGKLGIYCDFFHKRIFLKY